MALLAAGGVARAATPDATDDAFGILLAMPGAQPKEGGWTVPQEAAKDEEDLIAQWQDLKEDGADFNALRHGGTLLAHAIRAGKDRAALWLLGHGAATKKVLSKDHENADDLARRYKRAAVVEVLEGRYGLKPTPPSVPVRQPAASQAGAPVSPASASQTRVEQAIALMARLEIRSRYGSSKDSVDVAQQWRQFSSTLSQDEFAAVFKGGGQFESLVIVTRKADGALQEALDRLPDEVVRQHAQTIANVLAHWSFVTYAAQPRVEYSNAARAWPALWRRLDRPLRYDGEKDLAGSIPPELWPGLFASGYADREADGTGCLLAMVDPAGLKALWPDFQRLFNDALEEAPALVLASHRIDRSRQPCPDGSAASATAAKLAFLRAQGVVSPVYGLGLAGPDERVDPALAAMMAAFTPASVPPPRLVPMAPACELADRDRWLDSLIHARSVGWGVSPSSVQLVDLPGRPDCGLLVGGDNYPDWPSITDDFDDGPSREPMPRCADTPDDGEIWAMERDGIHRVEAATPNRSSGIRLRQVRDVETGRRYLLDTGQSGAVCNVFYGLPQAFEWQAGAKGPRLVPSPDGTLLDRLLRRQCSREDENADVVCPGIDDVEDPTPTADSTLARLQEGRTVSLHDLVDVLGAGRRAAYRAALAAHDHARWQELGKEGIPPWWTAAEIAALGKADLALEEKRRRIALLFADPAQLSQALHPDGSEAASSLGPWLPRPDWIPILRLVRKSPADWFDAKARFAPGDPAVGCELDHAQGFLCKGGLEP